ncbi:MAG: hypothetical protein LH468_07295 [Nocardioides sp.]|nr:hypothetical protein [Nocardioides sp.]
MLVCARRAAGSAVSLPAAATGVRSGRLLMSTTDGGDLRPGGDILTLPASDEPGFWIWEV